MRISKERREQIGNFAQAVINENEFLSIKSLVERFNQELNDSISVEELLHGIRRFIATEGIKNINFAIYEDSYLYEKSISNKEIESLIKMSLEEKPDAGLNTNPLETNMNEMVGLIAEIAAPLYGVVTFDQIDEIVKFYYSELGILPTNTKEILIDYAQNSTDGVDYTIFEDLVVSPMILDTVDDFSEYEAQMISSIQAEQVNHDRFLPSFQTFIQFASPRYEYSLPPIDKFYNFVLDNRDNFSVTKEQVIEAVDAFIGIVKVGLQEDQFLEFFQAEGFVFETKDVIEAFLNQAIICYRDVRLCRLNGHTLTEAGIEVRNFSFNVPRVVSKVGRNDPCTCGSGKKSKRCCG